MSSAYQRQRAMPLARWRDEAFEQMHMRILPIGRADRNLLFVVAAVWQPPVAFQRVALGFGGPEEVGTLQCAARVPA